MADKKQDQAPVITIDGPGGSGKGTIARRLARELNWHFLDSGALYRLVAVAAMDRGIEPDNEFALSELASVLNVRFEEAGDETRFVLNDEDVSDRMRTEAVSAFASQVAAQAGVREALLERQRAFRQEPGLVADGRDMGTIVFPQASHKFYLTASVQERAQRRHKQLKEKGESVNLSRLFRDIEERDRRDRTRPIAPLVPAEDAVHVDSTDLSIDEVMTVIYKSLKDRSIID